MSDFVAVGATNNRPHESVRITQHFFLAGGFDLDLLFAVPQLIFGDVDTLIAKGRDKGMLRTLFGLMAAAAIMATSVAAHAVTVTNWDKTEHTLSILEEDDEWSATIRPGETLRNLCSSPCSIALEPDEEQDLAGHETVTIVDGKLFVIQ